MNYEEFTVAMCDCIREMLSEDETVAVQKILKNNGVTLVGLSIRKEEEQVAPLIYLEHFYQRYMKGESVEVLSGDFMEKLKMTTSPTIQDFRDLFSKDEIQERVVYKLIHTEKNEELLKGVPHISIWNLSAVFYVPLKFSETETGGVLIRNEHLKLWDISAETLYRRALENTPRRYPYVIAGLSEMLPVPFNMGNQRDEILVLTNEEGFYGAAAILYPRVPNLLYERVGGGYYLLPASVHEFLVVPEDFGMDVESMTAMVREINTSNIPPEEFLSDDIYHFDGVNITKM